MGNIFLTMFENPHAIRGKVNKFDKVKWKKKEKKTFKWQRKPTPKPCVKRQMTKWEKDLQHIT